MSDADELTKLLRLRQTTRSVADLLQGDLRESLATLAPLLRPKVVLGQYVEGDAGVVVKGADKALEELRGLYDRVASSPLYGLRRDFPARLELVSATIEANPLEYTQMLAGGTGSAAQVTVTSPCTWVLSYAGYPPGRVTFASFGLKRIKELLATKTRAPEDLQQAVIQLLAMHLVLQRQPDLVRILGRLGFRFESRTLPEYGPLPIPCLQGPLSTFRPSDSVVLQTTQISGMPVFEEVVRPEDLDRMRDPLQERLRALIPAEPTAASAESSTEAEQGD